MRPPHSLTDFLKEYIRRTVSSATPVYSGTIISKRRLFRYFGFFCALPPDFSTAGVLDPPLT